MFGQIVTTNEIKLLLEKYAKGASKSLFECACRKAGFSSAEQAVKTYLKQGSAVSDKVKTQVGLIILGSKFTNGEFGFFLGAAVNFFVIESAPYTLEAGAQELLDEHISGEVSPHLSPGEVDESKRKKVIAAFCFAAPTAPK